MVVMFDRLPLNYVCEMRIWDANMHECVIMQGWLVIFHSPICRFESKAVKTASLSGAPIHANWHFSLVILGLPNSFNFDPFEQSHHLLEIAIQFVVTYKRKS